MTIKYADRVRESSNTSGAGDMTLNTSAEDGYRKIDTVFGNDLDDGTGLPFDYVITHTANDTWEIGTGHLLTISSFSRDTVLLNSLETTAKINFASGGVIITITPSRDTLANFELETLTAQTSIDGPIGAVTPNVGTFTQGFFKSGSSGAIASTNADEIVIDGTVVTGMTILSDDTGFSSFRHGSPGGSSGALTRWNFSTLQYDVGTNKVGAETTLYGDFFVPNLNLKGAVGFQLAAFFGDVSLASGKKLFFDGFSDTFIDSTGNDIIRMVTGNADNLTLSGTTGSEAAQFEGSVLALDGITSENSSGSAVVNLFRNDSTVGTGVDLGQLNFQGNDTTANAQTTLAAVRAQASATHGAGDNATDLLFLTTADNTDIVREVARFDDAGRLGIGITDPDGTLHVHTASAGAVTANLAADDLVVENSTSVGISILSPDADRSTLMFASPSDVSGFIVDWKFSDLDARVATGVVGASLLLRADNGVTNLTLAGASGSETAVFAGTVTATDGLTVTAGDLTLSNGKVSITSTANEVLLDLTGSNSTLPGIRLNTDTTNNLLVLNTSSIGAANGLTIDYSATAPNDSANHFLFFQDSTGEKFSVASNGDIVTDGAALIKSNTGIEIESLNPKLIFDETDAALDERTYRMVTSGGNFSIRLQNDAATLERTAFEIIRTGMVQDIIAFGNTTDNPSYIFQGTGDFKVGGSAVVGSSTETPLGTFHVFNGDSGATAAAAADTAVFESNGSDGISILGPAANNQNLYFGSNLANTGAFLRWNHNSNIFLAGPSRVGATHQLQADAGVLNLTLSGAAASELAAFVKDVTVGGNIALDTTSGNVTTHHIRPVSNSVDTTIHTGTTGDLILEGGAATALTLDQSQNAVFAGTLASGQFVSTDAVNISKIVSTTTFAALRITESGGSSWDLENDGGLFRVQLGGSSELELSGTRAALPGNTIIGETLAVAGDGTLHVHTATAGSVAASSNANDLVLENSGNTGMSILSPDANFSYIWFGSPSDNNGANIGWRFSSNIFGFATDKVGASIVLSPDGNITNLTLSGAAGSELAAYEGDVSIPSGFLNFGSAVELTIATGVVTATQTYQDIDTEAAASTDDLNTINGGTDGDIIILTPISNGRTVVCKDGVGNLSLNGDFSMTSTSDTITLLYNGALWLELSRSDNAA